MTFDTHAKCPSCMMGKAKSEDFPKAERPILKPLYQIHMDLISPSVRSMASEDYFHAIVFVYAVTGYIWISGMKTMDDAVHVFKR